MNCKKKLKKKKIAILVIFFVICLISLFVISTYKNDFLAAYTSQKYEEKEDRYDEEEAEKLKQNLREEWSLILVNKKNYVKDSLNVQFKEYNGYKVDYRIYDDLNNMFLNAKKDGVSLQIISGYRTKERSET
ncbi:MAG: hypothetical protein ACRCZK_07210, partial [Oscillospiraceae bacterium]